MIYLVYGDDTFSSLNRVKEILKDKDIQIIEYEEKSIDEIMLALRSRTFFSGERVIVIKDPFSNTELLDRWEGLKKSSNDILLHHSGKLPKEVKKKHLKELTVEEYLTPKKDELLSWAISEGEKLNLKISRPIAQLLIQRTDGDTWRVHNELDKLAHWKDATDDQIQEVLQEDVDLFLSPKTEESIFKTIDAIANKQRSKAIGLIRMNLDNGDSPIYLLSMIAYQFSNLLIVKDKVEKDKDVNQLDLHPYVIKKTYNLSRGFTFNELKDIYDMIVDMDYRVKTGRVDPELSLELLISRI